MATFLAQVESAVKEAILERREKAVDGAGEKQKFGKQKVEMERTEISSSARTGHGGAKAVDG